MSDSIRLTNLEDQARANLAGSRALETLAARYPRLRWNSDTRLWPVHNEVRRITWNAIALREPEEVAIQAGIAAGEQMLPDLFPPRLLKPAAPKPDQAAQQAPAWKPSAHVQDLLFLLDRANQQITFRFGRTEETYSLRNGALLDCNDGPGFPSEVSRYVRDKVRAALPAHRTDPTPPSAA